MRLEGMRMGMPQLEWFVRLYFRIFLMDTGSLRCHLHQNKNNHGGMSNFCKRKMHLYCFVLDVSHTFQ